MTSNIISLLVLVLAPLVSSSSDWEEIFHAGCKNTTMSNYSQTHQKHASLSLNGSSLMAECSSCVSATVKAQGDPTRCHSCQKAMTTDDLKTSCLSCVPKAEAMKLGWACSQYCTHHHIVSNREEAEQCHDCLLDPSVKDKWGCHVCMEQISGIHLEARAGCFQCLGGGQPGIMYRCGACGRVVDPVGRKECYSCLKKNGNHGDCLSMHNITLHFNRPPSQAAEIIERLKDRANLPHTRYSL